MLKISLVSYDRFDLTNCRVTAKRSIGREMILGRNGRMGRSGGERDW